VLAWVEKLLNISDTEEVEFVQAANASAGTVERSWLQSRSMLLVM
jgi:hypothetical protein